MLVLNKFLIVYHTLIKILGSSLLNETSPPKHLQDIKEILIKSIEREVQNHPNFLNCTEEEFLYLNSKCWSKFFAMLKQYDYDARQPMRLFVEPLNESSIILMRKSSVSVFTKTDLSQIYKVCQPDTIRAYFSQSNTSKNHQITDMNEANDVYAVFMSIRCINEYLNDVFSHLLAPSSSAFTDDSSYISTSSSSVYFINMLTDNLALSNKDFLNTFYSCLHKIKQLDLLANKIKLILKYFEIEEHQQDTLYAHDTDTMVMQGDQLKFSNEFALAMLIQCITLSNIS